MKLCVSSAVLIAVSLLASKALDFDINIKNICIFQLKISFLRVILLGKENKTLKKDQYEKSLNK